MDNSSITATLEYINVTVVSPQEVLFSGQAKSVSSKNSAGNFDILPQHAHFITIVENHPIIVRTVDKKNLTFKFPLAIIYNFENNVKVFAQLPITQVS